VSTAGARGGAHVVRSGDTLWGIARAYRVPLDRLLAANGLSAGHVLKIGQRLVIPRA
jgi:LysM repeat protein